MRHDEVHEELQRHNDALSHEDEDEDVLKLEERFFGKVRDEGEGNGSWAAG